MKKAYNRDILRSLNRSKKRFISIMLIAMLGVTMMTGLRAACVDLRYSADRFYDEQGLFDISIASTLGLTDEDVAALEKLEAVENAEGAYSERVYVEVNGKRQRAEVKALSSKGINVPYVLEGNLPAAMNEIAVTNKYLKNSNKKVGDSVTIEEEEKEEENGFLVTDFKITAVVTDAADVNKNEGSSSFRASSSSDYTFFVTPQAVKSDIYTSVYLQIAEARELQTYGPEYEEKVKQVIGEIEDGIKAQRERARYDEVTAKAYDKLRDAEKEMEEEFAKAEQELIDGRQELTDGRKRVEDGERELAAKERDAKAQFALARSEIIKGERELASGRKQLETSKQELENGESQLAGAKAELEQKQQQVNSQFAAAVRQLKASLGQLNDEYESLSQQADQAGLAFGSGFPEKEWQSLIAAAKSAYIPVTELQGAISMQEQQMEALEPDTEEYKKAAAALEQNKKQLAAADKEAAKSLEPVRQSFVNKLTPALTGIKAAIDAQIAALDKNAPDYKEQFSALEKQKKQLEYTAAQLPELAIALGQMEAGKISLDLQIEQVNSQQKQAEAEFAAAWKTIGENDEQLKSGRSKLESGFSEMEAGEKQLKAGEQELAAQEQQAFKQIAEGRQQLADSKSALESGERELMDGQQEYNSKRADAEKEIAEARMDIESIDMTKWYVQDRSSLSGYSNILSDSSSIEALGTVFPVLFLFVAVLISLTTTTRMVEEERGLIGTYKALGFTDREIRRKYLIYGLAASITGGLLGDICGFIVLPKFIFNIFNTMYVLPEYTMQFELVYGIGGILLFVCFICGATVFACSSELRQTPASLMRPKAPSLGSRVFLERISGLWNRLSFLNKVAARNLFRYKKRLLMTVCGIMGCTALLVCGFAIKDSVTELMPKQYEHIYGYDLMAAASPGDGDKLFSSLDRSADVDEYVNLKIDSVKLGNAAGKEEKPQLIVIPVGADISKYIRIEDLSGNRVTVGDSGLYVTQNAARVLNFKEGDVVSLQNTDLVKVEATVSGIVENYLGNNVYMSQKLYEELFGEFEPNGALVRLAEECDTIAYAQNLAEQDGVLTSISTDAMKRDFASAFSMVNMAVYIIITMAAGLAIVVLFTLSTTNISERTRELATIKVLGFYDREVHLYVNKETVILTLFGVLLGLPVGHVLAGALTYALNMPAVHFAVTIHKASYVLSAVIALSFAIIVNVITNVILDKINPVEALKSVE